MKPDIENLIATIYRKKGVRVPIIELGIHPAIKKKYIGRPIQTLEDDIDFWASAGYDYIKLQPGADFDPDRKKDKNSSNSTAGDSAFQWASERKGIISSFKDLEQYTFPQAQDFDYSSFERVKKLLPDGLGVIGQYGDIFTMTWEMMGFETFSLALYENPQLIQLLNQKLGDLVISMYKFFAQSDAVDILWYSDDIAYQGGLLMSPEVLQQFFFPWLQKIGNIAKKAAKPLLYHSDGILFDVMEDLISCGIDALHPIEPQAMDLAEVKARYGDRLCLMGYVDVDMLCRGSREEIRQQVRQNIEVAAQNGGYCLGSGNSIPNYVKFENYVAMLEATAEFGQFDR